MEEGPEPQEWVERTAEEHHHAHSGAASADSSHAVPAITAAVLAVLAALGSLLSGHAANEAILGMTRATDQWAYYQAKSTKGHLYEVASELVATLGRGSSTGSSPAGTPTDAAGVDRFRSEAQRYDREKGEIQHEAESLEAESRHELHRHHRYALAVALFQVGIVLASVSLLVRVRGLYVLSLAAGVAGVVCLVLGFTA
jgi:hypothetical protein